MEYRGQKLYLPGILWFDSPQEATIFWQSRHQFFEDRGYVLDAVKPVEEPATSHENGGQDVGSTRYVRKLIL